MNIQAEVNLQDLNTLAVPSVAEYFFSASSPLELQDCLLWSDKNQKPLNILGGGSNVILAPYIKGLTLRPLILMREVIEKTDTDVLIRFGAGETWHGIVEWCLVHGFYGLEPLALIPGTVGAAPVQNIGAYGADLSHFVDSVECIERATYKVLTLQNRECCFAYRDSIFKSELANKAIITYVTLRLSLLPLIEVKYPALESALPAGEVITPKLIFDTVCSVRRSKLPEPKETPNSGSFFKNPIVDWDHYQSILLQYPDIPSYPASAESSKEAKAPRKLAAAWLIDQAGWKGVSRYGARVHDKQALVLTNPNKTNAESVLLLAQAICDSVQYKFSVDLIMEPQKLGWS